MVAFLATSVVVYGVPSLPEAAADPIAGTQAEIQALQQQIDNGAARVHQLTAAYSQAAGAAAAASSQIAADQAQMGALQRQVASRRGVLRQEAVLSYTGAVEGYLPATTNPTATEVSSEYLSMTVGDVADTVDQLRLQQRQLSDAEAGVRAEQSTERQDMQRAAGARRQALAQAAAEQSLLAGDQRRLSALEAAAAAQAQAARQAAEAAARRSSAPPAQGLPVGGGLVRAVTEVMAPVAPAPAPAPSPSPPPPPPSPSPLGGVWLQLRQCESGDNYQENTGNGFYGAYQFSQSTWTGLGYPGRPDLAPPAMQDQAAQKLQAQAGWGSWPACSAMLGLT